MEIKESTNNRALKSGIVYAIATIINAATVFISTPFFTRVMSKDLYGSYDNFLSWYNIFSIVSLNLNATFISAKKDYEKTFDSYIKSMVFLNILIVGASTIIINLFYGYITQYTMISQKYINIMLLYIAMYQLFMMYQVKERFDFKYKLSSLLIILNAIITTLISMALVLLCKNQLYGRILGWALPTSIIGVCILLYYSRNGLAVSLGHWKYAVPIALPYVPHVLSLTILNSVDRTMITRYIGTSETAIYSVAYTCGSMISLVIGAMNNAFAPWLVNRLVNNDKKAIQRISKYYIMIFEVILIGLLLIAPEVIMILGGKKYASAINILPTIMIGCSLQLIYTMYVNVEQYRKKTLPMAIISVIAAGSNYFLNMIAIPRIGYEVAAVTTLASYLILTMGHMGIVKLIGDFDIYNWKLILVIIILDLFLVPIFGFVYGSIIIRLLMVVIYVIIVFFLLKKNMKIIENIILIIKRK